MKVLHVAESIKGGIATQLCALWQAQAAAYGAANVRLAVPAGHAGELTAVPAQQIRRLPHAPRGPFGVVCHLRAVAAAIRAEAPDVVHAHSAFAGAATRLLKAAGQCPAPIVYCPHGWAFDRAGRSPATWLYRAVELGLAPLSAAILCISKHDLRRARAAGIPRRRLRLVYNGLPESPHAGRGCDRPAATQRADVLRIAFVGRLDRQKGFDVLHAAVGRLQRPVEVICVGDAVLGDGGAPFRGANEKAVAYRGWLPPAGVAAELHRADVAVVPSRWEGFGLAAAEALREGTPVIATRRGGLPEVVAHDVTGWLISAPDPAVLADALESLEPERLARWQRAAGARFRTHFTAPAMSARTMAVYAAVTGGAPPAQDSERA